MDSWTIWPLYTSENVSRNIKNFTLMCDLDLRPTGMNVSNGTWTRDGEQFCQIILKSIHNCRSYGRTDTCTHTHRTLIVTTMSHKAQEV